MLQFHPDMVPGGFLGVFVIILGLLNLGLFIWFSVAVLNMTRNKIKGNLFLKWYIVVALILLTASLILTLVGVQHKAVEGLLTRNINGIQYIFLAIFFMKKIDVYPSAVNSR